MGLGFDGQLPLLLRLKDAVVTGESVHSGTGVGERVAGTGEEFPGVPTTSTASSATSSPGRAARALPFLHLSRNIAFAHLQSDSELRFILK